MRQIFLTKEHLARIEAELAGKIQQFLFASYNPLNNPPSQQRERGFGKSESPSLQFLLVLYVIHQIIRRSTRPLSAFPARLIDGLNMKEIVVMSIEGSEYILPLWHVYHLQEFFCHPLFSVRSTWVWECIQYILWQHQQDIRPT